MDRIDYLGCNIKFFSCMGRDYFHYFRSGIKNQKENEN